MPIQSTKAWIAEFADGSVSVLFINKVLNGECPENKQNRPQTRISNYKIMKSDVLQGIRPSL